VLDFLFMAYFPLNQMYNDFIVIEATDAVNGTSTTSLTYTKNIYYNKDFANE
jgi:hypothetical protein